jgi:hypothetical protein
MTMKTITFTALAMVIGMFGLNAVTSTADIAYAQAKPPLPTLTLVTKPDPPVMGQTTFTVTLKAPDGKAVTGADVTVELVMPAMPAMKMAEMRNKVALKPATDAKLAAAGTYTGTGQVMMAGTWNVVVTAKVNGKDYAEKKLTITAK